jgi:sulfite exporter TauE/SafE
VNTWLSILGASLLGSLHCAAMCGGLVTFYSAGEGSASGARYSAHAAYHSLRLVAYVLLGGAAGALGSALDGFGNELGVGALGLVLAGVTLLSWAVPRLLGARSGSRLLALGRAPARRGRFVGTLATLFVGLVERVRALPPLVRAAALGLASALLPCGWLYAFVVLAASTGSAVAGAGILAAFWLGTVPALLGLGIGIGRLSGRLRAHLPRLSVSLVLLVCVFNIITRWPSVQAAELTVGAQPGRPTCHGPH